jgi:6-phosphogluconolactonase (cycloisomerase 2 family)
MPLVLCAADKANKSTAKPPDSPVYVLTNDDGVQHSYVGFYLAGGTQGAPTLTYQKTINTLRRGIGGGYFAIPRLNMLPDPSAQCLYASNAATGDITAIDLQAQSLAGVFDASENDVGDANGIGVVLNANYLYAGFSTSNTIATFSIQPGCQLTFLSDVPAAGLNGGSPSGMALHGNILVVAYADGSIESFNIANGAPVSNGDAQNSTGFAQAYFPEGVDITQDGHFAIFGDSSVPTTVEVSDISSGKLTTTVMYTVATPTNAVGPGLNAAAVRLSPDESLLYVTNNDGGTVSAAFFDKQTGRVTRGCTSPTLRDFYNPWAYVGSIATRDATGTGGVLYVAEFGFTGSYIGFLEVQSDGVTCALSEAAASPVADQFTSGLLSIQVFPPRPF